MKIKLTISLVIVLLIFSCKKEEQSCSDGIFTPEKEEKTDCGGVCPPCDFQPTVIDTYLSVQVDEDRIYFDDFSLDKAPEWILTFQNDSLSVNLNFGDGDSLGGRPIESTYSYAQMNTVNYSTLHSGFVLFTEIDHAENLLSGYFRGKFISDDNVYDTLVITSAEFEKINW